MTSATTGARLWYAQRVSAMVLALCVVAHLAIIVAATHAGLTAGALLTRTRGSIAFAAFYGVFVVACAIHAPIGLRNVAAEWLRWRGRAADAVWLAAALAVLVAGGRAVYAVVVP
jgi:succinate dehydrogenase subunit C